MLKWLALILVLAGTLFSVYQVWLFVHVWWWVDHNPSSSALMNERLSEMRTSQPNAQLQHTWVPYNQISANLKRALIADEDTKFLNHHGFDWEGMRAAAQKDITRGHIVAGGSTISQQLAKNLLLSSQRTPWRKLEEALVTVMLEHMMNKRRIFEIYLTRIFHKFA